MARQLSRPADVRRFAAGRPAGHNGRKTAITSYIQQVKGNDELGGVSIYAFNDQRRLQTVRYAASKSEIPDNDKVWRLSQVDESDLTDPKQIWPPDGQRTWKLS